MLGFIKFELLGLIFFFLYLGLIVLEHLLSLHLRVQVGETHIINSDVEMLSILNYDKLVSQVIKLISECDIKLLIICNQRTISEYTSSPTQL